MPRKPIPAAESLAPLPFPEKGLDVSEPLTKQPPGTTAVGQNVRLYDALGQRARGGSRSGLSKYVPEQLVYSTILQEMIAWWPLTEATGTRADLLNIYPLTPTVPSPPVGGLSGLSPTSGPGLPGTGPATVFPISPTFPLVGFSYLYTTQEVCSDGAPMTVAGWVNRLGAPQGGPLATFLIFAMQWEFGVSSSGQLGFFSINQLDARLTGATTSFGTGTSNLSVAAPFALNTWVHIAVTIQRQFMAVYINGSATPLVTVSTPLTPAFGGTVSGEYVIFLADGAFYPPVVVPYNFALGSRGSSPANLAMVAWAAWSRILTAGEISSLWNNGNGTTLGAIVEASAFDAPPGTAALQVIQDLNTVVSIGTCLETTSSGYQEGDVNWTAIWHAGTYILAYQNGANPWKVSCVLGVDVQGGWRVGQPIPGTPTTDNFGPTLSSLIALPPNYQVLAYWQPGAFPFQGDFQNGSVFPGFGWMRTHFPSGVQDTAFGFPSATTPGFTVPDAPTQHGLPTIPFWTITTGATVCCVDSTFLRVQGLAIAINSYSDTVGIDGSVLPFTMKYTVEINGQTFTTGTISVTTQPLAARVFGSANFLVLTDSRAARYHLNNNCPPGFNANVNVIGPGAGGADPPIGEWQVVTPHCGAFLKNGLNRATVFFDWSGFTAHLFAAGNFADFHINMVALHFNRLVGPWQFVGLTDPNGPDPLGVGKVFNSIDMADISFVLPYIPSQPQNSGGTAVPDGVDIFPNSGGTLSYGKFAGPVQQQPVRCTGFLTIAWIDNTIN